MQKFYSLDNGHEVTTKTLTMCNMCVIQNHKFKKIVPLPDEPLKGMSVECTLDKVEEPFSGCKEI